MQSDSKVLTKSKHGLVSGTLRGLADYYSLNLNGLQLVFIIAVFFGIGLVLYFVLWISIPSYSQKEALLNELQSKQE